MIGTNETSRNLEQHEIQLQDMKQKNILEYKNWGNKKKMDKAKNQFQPREEEDQVVV